MKVAFVPVWNSNPYHTELTAALRGLGVDVVHPKHLKDLYRETIRGQAGVDVLHLHALPYFDLSPVNVARYLLFYWRLRRMRKKGVRVVWTVHDLQNHDSRFQNIENFVERYASSRLDALIVHGSGAKQLIDTRWDDDKTRRVFIVPHGNYIDSYKNHATGETARRALGFTGPETVFLFIGLIRPYKGVVEMVHSFTKCSDRNARLIIAGRPVTDAIKNEVEAAIADDERIKFFPGMVEDDDIQFYMNAADVVVLPYRRVLTSGVAMLGMSFAKACIAPRTGSVTDMLDDNGAIFFDPSRRGSLERAFNKALASTGQLKEMGRYNFERATKWDWKSIGKATAAVYDFCLRDRKRLDRSAAHEISLNSSNKERAEAGVS